MLIFTFNDLSVKINSKIWEVIVYTKGDVENGAIPAGQSCGLIDTIMDVDDIITNFTKKAEDLLKKATAKIF